MPCSQGPEGLQHRTGLLASVQSDGEMVMGVMGIQSALVVG